MKCPKCGYNSFEFFDSCKKCSSDLGSFKESLGIRGVVLPFRAAAPAESAPAQEAGTTFPEFDLGLPEQPNEAGGALTFGEEPFAAPVEAPVAGEDSYGDFSFEETGSETQSFETAASSQPFGDDSFADLLESRADTTANETTPAAFDGQGLPSFAESAQGEGPGAGPSFEPAATAGEFEMEDFFLEEEPPTPGKPAKGPTVEPQGLSKDEFDSLFGEGEESGEADPK